MPFFDSMGDPNETDERLDRRTFLQKSAVGSLGVAGWAAQDGGNGQSDGSGDGQGGGDGTERPLYERRFVFPYPEVFGPKQEPKESGDPSGDLLQKIIIVTDRKDTNPDQLDISEEELINCNFGDWAKDKQLQEWEAIIVDWKNAGQLLGAFEDTKRVQATQLVELSSLVANPRPDPVPLGTTFIINSVTKCPGDIVGVTAQKVPGIRIVTGPGESTGETNQTG